MAYIFLLKSVSHVGFLPVLLLLLLAGCSRTVVSGGLGSSAFSPGDGRFQIGVSVASPPGKGYTELNRKKLTVEIVEVLGDNSVNSRLSETYSIQVGDVRAEARWLGPHAVQISFPLRATHVGRAPSETPTLKFRFEQSSRRFIEVERRGPAQDSQ